MRRAELREVIPVERERLVRDLRGLPADAWEEPSLCERWCVRHVVGHLIRSDEAFRRGYPLLVDMLRGGFRPQVSLALAARRRSDGCPPDELIAALANTRYEVGVRVHPTPDVPLGELLIHGQDIRRALGIDHDVPGRTFAAAADGTVTYVRRLFAWGRVPRDVRFEATDVDWCYGEGEVVRGPIEAITMVLAGRRSAIADLEGPARTRL